MANLDDFFKMWKYKAGYLRSRLPWGRGEQ
jgi:hypothetical protein